MQDLKLFKAEGSKLSELKTDRNRSQEVRKGPGYISWGKSPVRPEDAGFYICKSGKEAAVTTFSVYGKTILITTGTPQCDEEQRRVYAKLKIHII